MSIFGKARAGENLSPAARSFLRLLEGLAATAVVAALPVVSDALSQGSVNWSDVGRAAIAAASTAVLLAAVKYARAQGDAPLPAATASVTTLAPATPLVAASPFAPLSPIAPVAPFAPDADAPILVQDEPAPAPTA